jgi:hypothetical protein
MDREPPPPTVGLFLIKVSWYEGKVMKLIMNFQNSFNEYSFKGSLMSQSIAEL